jgi:hypothetical protein
MGMCHFHQITKSDHGVIEGRVGATGLHELSTDRGPGALPLERVRSVHTQSSFATYRTGH